MAAKQDLRRATLHILPRGIFKKSEEEYDIPIEDRIRRITSHVPAGAKRGDGLLVPEFKADRNQGIYWWDGTKVLGFREDEDKFGDYGCVPIAANEVGSIMYFSDASPFTVDVNFDFSGVKIVNVDKKDTPEDHVDECGPHYWVHTLVETRGKDNLTWYLVSNKHWAIEDLVSQTSVMRSHDDALPVPECPSDETVMFIFERADHE